MALDISTMKREEDNVVIFNLRGSLDSDTFDTFKAHALKYIDAKPRAVILDLERLDYISSMGITSVLEVRRAIEEQGGSMMMANVPRHIDQVFKIVQALPDVRVFESMEETDRYFQEIQDRIKQNKA